MKKLIISSTLNFKAFKQTLPSRNNFKNRKSLKNLFLSALLTAPFFTAYGQEPEFDPEHQECGFLSEPQPDETERAANCSNSSTTYLNKYRAPGFWTPDVNNNTPIKTIKINFVVFQQDDGSGTGAMVDNAVAHTQFQQLVADINYRYSHSEIKGYPSTCQPSIDYITDTRIRFVLNDVLFFQNSDIYNGITSDADMLQLIHTASPSSKNCLNICIVKILNDYPIEPNNV
ncbi:MAG TPA: hypothetical protein VD905_17755, partial [Flavobacteriales bacterium]|nr:hypothetical protein [Flavobacteriales bacterium]